MGWSSVEVFYLDFKNGKYDRKAYLDKEWNTHTNEASWEVLKSSMVGSTYYAAIKHTIFATGEVMVFADITITSIENNQFWYKDMSESMGPYKYDCPVSILNLLSPTDNEYALQWRENCQLMRMAKNQRNTFFKLANVGRRKIKYILPKDYQAGYDKGQVVWLSKYSRWNKRTKKEDFVWSDGCYRWPKTMIDEKCCQIYEEDGKTLVPFAIVDIEGVK